MQVVRSYKAVAKIRLQADPQGARCNKDRAWIIATGIVFTSGSKFSRRLSSAPTIEFCAWLAMSRDTRHETLRVSLHNAIVRYNALAFHFELHCLCVINAGQC